MTQALDTKRKVLIGVSATMLIGAAVAAAYSAMTPSVPAQPTVSLEAAPQAQAPNLLAGTQDASAAQPPEVVYPSEHYSQSPEPPPDVTPAFKTPTQAILDTALPQSAQTILSLSEQIQLNELRTARDKAALQAKEAQAALTGNAANPHLLNTQLGLDTSNADSNQPESLLEQVKVRSLASTPGGMTGWVALGSELIPIQKGTQIGDITVVRLTEQYVVFLYQGQHARKYAGS